MANKNTQKVKRRRERRFVDDTMKAFDAFLAGRKMILVFRKCVGTFSDCEGCKLYYNDDLKRTLQFRVECYSDIDRIKYIEEVPMTMKDFGWGDDSPVARSFSLPARPWDRLGGEFRTREQCNLTHWEDMPSIPFYYPGDKGMSRDSVWCKLLYQWCYSQVLAIAVSPRDGKLFFDYVFSHVAFTYIKE